MTDPTTPTTGSFEDDKPSPLEERLKMLIAQRGPISIADYMIDALSHPHEGYYMTQTALGSEGDFTTAPEISQVFGEIIGLWLVQSWLEMGSPEQFNLVELGPGRGILMNDILRAARLRPKFIQGAAIYLVETSGRLRHEQKKSLKLHSEAKIKWVDRFEDVPEQPTLVIANEFFDCLPIRQYQKTRLGWQERLVGLDIASNNLAFELAPVPTKPEHPLALEPGAHDGDIIEMSASALKIAGKIGRFLKENQGRALFIDYGHYSSAYGDSFQSVRNHQYWPPLMAPGKADLTAHVDFQQICASALHEGVSVYGPIAQGTFLDRLGLTYRLESLCSGQSEEQQIRIRDAASRLVSPDQMGELFKVMCLATPDLNPPAGFET